MQRNTKKTRRLSKHNKKHNKPNRRNRHTKKRVRRGGAWPWEAQPDTPPGEQPTVQTEEQPVTENITIPTTEIKIPDQDLISNVLVGYLSRIEKAINGKEFKDGNNKFTDIPPEKISYAKEFLSDNEKRDKLIHEILANKSKDISPYAELWKDIENYTINDIDKLQNTGLETEVFGKLQDIIYKYKDADNIVEKITDLLGKPVIKQQLSDKQIENIKNILTNKGSTLGSLSKNFASGIQSFGTWLVPAVTTDDSGNPIKEHNETKVHFLWYPRMYPRYRKGNSRAEKDIKYGNFMVYIEPEKYASTLEFINQTTSGVDDFLTNILDGFQQPSVIPKPYKRFTLKMKNYEPYRDKEAALVNPLNKPSQEPKK